MIKSRDRQSCEKQFLELLVVLKEEKISFEYAICINDVEYETEVIYIISME